MENIEGGEFFSEERSSCYIPLQAVSEVSTKCECHMVSSGDICTPEPNSNSMDGVD